MSDISQRERNLNVYLKLWDKIHESAEATTCPMCRGPSVWYALDIHGAFPTITIDYEEGHDLEIIRQACSRCGFIASHVVKYVERDIDPHYDEGDLHEAARATGDLEESS